MAKPLLFAEWLLLSGHSKLILEHSSHAATLQQQKQPISRSWDTRPRKYCRGLAVTPPLIHLPSEENSVRIPKLVCVELEKRVARGCAAREERSVLEEERPMLRCVPWAQRKDPSAPSSSGWGTQTVRLAFLGDHLKMRFCMWPCESW